MHMSRSSFRTMRCDLKSLNQIIVYLRGFYVAKKQTLIILIVCFFVVNQRSNEELVLSYPEK